MKNEIKIKEKFDIAIIDTMNFAYKYYFVHKNLHTLSGIWTGIYYGFFAKIDQILKEHPGIKIIFAWDRESKIRKQIDEYYKINRESKKEQMSKELRELRVMISMFGLRQCYANGYEADDVIAKIIKNNLDKKIIIYSSDKDLFQLLSDNVFICRKKGPKTKEKIYSIDEIEEDFNINVNSYTLYKAITGDSGDNVLGIPRINRFEVKKFVDFINGDLSRIYSISNMKKFQKIKKNIILNFGLIEKNYELVKLYTDFELKEIEIKKDLNRLKNKFYKYEMKKALENLLGEK